MVWRVHGLTVILLLLLLLLLFVCYTPRPPEKCAFSKKRQSLFAAYIFDRENLATTYRDYFFDKRLISFLIASISSHFNDLVSACCRRRTSPTSVVFKFSLCEKFCGRQLSQQRTLP